MINKDHAKRIVNKYYKGSKTLQENRINCIKACLKFVPYQTLEDKQNLELVAIELVHKKHLDWLSEGL